MGSIVESFAAAEVAKKDYGFLIVEVKRKAVENASFVASGDLHSPRSANQLPTGLGTADYDHFPAKPDPVSAASMATNHHFESLKC